MKIFLHERFIEFIPNPGSFEGELVWAINSTDTSDLERGWNAFCSNNNIRRLLLPTGAFEPFCTLFRVINAAGGRVENEHGDLLMIHRNGSWDLPKGKIEAGETPQLAAIREVQEETGLTAVELLDPLDCTYHLYFEKKHWILKRTWWYAMRASSSQPLVPQTSEGIALIRWVPPNAIDCLVAHAYDSLKEVIQLAD